MRLLREVEPVEHTIEGGTHVVRINSKDGGRSVVVRLDWSDGSAVVETAEWDEPAGLPVLLRPVGPPTWAWMNPAETATLRAQRARENART